MYHHCPNDASYYPEESMDLESYSHDNEPEEQIQLQAKTPGEVYRRACMRCNRVLMEYYVKCSRGTWHAECFRCSNCNQQIHENVVWRRNDPQHKTCDPMQLTNSYDHIRPTCVVCTKGLSSEYEADEYWGQKYCTSHNNDRTPRCSSCRRIEPGDMKYISLGDARKLCLKCLDSAIMSTEECKPLLEDIKIFFEGLNMKVRVDFPVHLVERSALNDDVSEEDSHILHNLTEIRGICTFESQMVPPCQISKGPTKTGNILSGFQTKSAKVTGVFVLFGYPRMLCGELLARQMMHAWMRQNGYPSTLPSELEEGMAQVMAYRWLEAESLAGNGGNYRSTKGTRSPFDRELGNYFQKSLLENPDPVYGEGFRVALRAVNTHGLRNILVHIGSYGRLP